jgi:hypothetical protein
MSKATVLDPTTGPASARGGLASRSYSLSHKAGRLRDMPKPRGMDFLERVAVGERYSLTTEPNRWP